MTNAKTLELALDALLQPEKFRDYGPNGLQVEGDREVKLLVSGVTASRALIEEAIKVLAWSGWPRHRLDARAFALAARSWPASVCLPSATRCACRVGQQCPARPGAGLACRWAFWRAGSGFYGRVRVELDKRAGLGGTCGNRFGAFGHLRGGCQASRPPCGLVHGWSAVLFRGRDCRRRRCLHHRRDFRAPDPSGA